MAGTGSFSVDTTFRLIDRMTSGARRMTRNVDRQMRAIKKATQTTGAAFDGMARRASGAARTLTTTSAAAAGALALIAKPGAEFEQAITNVGAVSLKSRAEIGALEERAKELGATTKFTATEAANAMEIMARAGFGQQEILAGVGGVLSAASASGLEMAEVADVVSNTMKGMGLAATDAATGLSNAQRIADVLTVASSKTNSTIGTLGESMSKISPVASQFGISLEDSVAMAALLQDVGLDASEAGTATATMLTKLTKPSSAVAAQMKKLGVSFKTTEGNMKNPVELFQEMLVASDKMPGNMDKVAFFADLVGLRGQRAALQLQKLFNSDKGSELREALANSSGQAERMARLRLDTLTGDLTLLESTADAVRIKFFESNDNLRGIVQGVRGWVEQNGELLASGLTRFLQDMIRSLPRIIRLVAALVKLFLLFKGAALAVWAVNAALTVYQVTAGGAAVVTRAASFLTSGYAAAQMMLALTTGSATTGLAAFGLALATIVLPLTVIGATVAWVIYQLSELKKLLVGENGSVLDLGMRMLSGQSLTEASDAIQNEQAIARFNREKQGLGGGNAPGSLNAAALSGTGAGGQIDFEGLLGILSGAAPGATAAPPMVPPTGDGPQAAPDWTQIQATLSEMQKNPPTQQIELVLAGATENVVDVRAPQGDKGVRVRRTGAD